jgi:glycerol uptake facilitator-like aquaporin
MNLNKYLVEFLGTVILMYVILATQNWVAIGATLAVIALLGAPISGGAYNPAVAISLYTAGKVSKTDLIPYIIVEILGALFAYYLYKKFVK